MLSCIKSIATKAFGGAALRQFHTSLASGAMRVELVPVLDDNYAYLLIDDQSQECALVDPVKPAVVLEKAKELGVNPTTALTTHHHWDHAGGNKELFSLRPDLRFYGGDTRIEPEGSLKIVTHGDTMEVGNIKIECLFTPCHTTGHICYFVRDSVTDDIAVFTGDTLFAGGCGRFFEGNAQQMHKNLRIILGQLPDTTKVYCGHEYSLGNLAYGQHVEPENTVIAEKIKWCQERRKQGLPTVPTTIGEEKLINPFMRVHEPSVQKHAGTTTEVDTMQSLRSEKDNFKAKV